MLADEHVWEEGELGSCHVCLHDLALALAPENFDDFAIEHEPRIRHVNLLTRSNHLDLLELLNVLQRIGVTGRYVKLAIPIDVQYKSSQVRIGVKEVDNSFD